ncbi:MAG: LysM peptidoglycan-binding domain-containing protein [Gammaproteobacteria bacterium]|nr:LysM peptidoglycan-binding domain-containing protein [Gammaproteobacteria bacterium]
MMKKSVLLLFMWLGLTGLTLADEIVLKDTHPTNYVVKRGDTLWDIASRFLRDPWRWPDIWYVNPQIKNPHLIYPGDEVVLTYKDGKPQLVLKRANTSQDNLRVVKISPSIRSTSLRRAVPTIPVDAIQQFLSRPDVMTEDKLKASPYVLAFQDDRLISGMGNTVYVRGIVPGSNTRYSLIRSGKVYEDNGEVLGIEAIYVGEAVVNNFGDPSTLTIAESRREVLLGDKLTPAVSEKLEYNFTPHAPKNNIDGKIISVVDGVSQIGQYHTVVINRGVDHGIEKGHVLAIHQKGREVRDPETGDKVVLPDEHAGYILIFRPFNKVSYALVMKATREISLQDLVTNP